LQRAAVTRRGTKHLLLNPPPAAQGLHGLQGLHALAAQGLQGFFAAQGLQPFFAPHGFLAAQGLHPFFAAHGLRPAHGLQRFLAAQGLAANATPGSNWPTIAAPPRATPVPTTSGITVVDNSFRLSGTILTSRCYPCSYTEPIFF
jgi:hypothetical protein